jgi:hypothetical protein
MGRRIAEEHRALVACADRGEMFYVHDTTCNFDVIDPREHRILLANLVKRTRYFITHWAKFDELTETGSHQEMGSRFFEGAAGGAVMIGSPPRCAAYDQCFDWPGAVIPTDRDGGRLPALVADLEAEPQRVARIRRNNIVHSLRRHDWAYRWRKVLDSVGLPATARAVEREERLNHIAEAVARHHCSRSC